MKETGENGYSVRVYNEGYGIYNDDNSVATTDGFDSLSATINWLYSDKVGGNGELHVKSLALNECAADTVEIDMHLPCGDYPAPITTSSGIVVDSDDKCLDNWFKVHNTGATVRDLADIRCSNCEEPEPYHYDEIEFRPYFRDGKRAYEVSLHNKKNSNTKVYWTDLGDGDLTTANGLTAKVHWKSSTVSKVGTWGSLQVKALKNVGSPFCYGKGCSPNTIEINMDIPCDA